MRFRPEAVDDSEKLGFYSDFFTKEVGKRRAFDGGERRVDGPRKWKRFRRFKIKTRRRQPWSVKAPDIPEDPTVTEVTQCHIS